MEEQAIARYYLYFLACLAIPVVLSVSPAYASDWLQHQSVPLHIGNANEKISQLSPRFFIVSDNTGGETVYNLASVIAMGNTAYIGTLGSSLVAIRRSDGTEKWRVGINGPTRGTPAYIDGKIIMATADGYIEAYDPLDEGGLLWSTFIKGAIGASPTVAHVGNENRIYAASTDGRILCLDVGTGGTLWEATTKAQLWGAPSLNQECTRVYIGGYDGQVYAFNAISGKLEWATDPEDISLGPIRATIAVNGKDLYVSTLRKGLVVLKDYGNGVVESWRISLTGTHTGSPAVALRPGVISSTLIYVANDAGKVYAINAGSQSVKWTKDSLDGHKVVGSVAYASDLVFVATEGKHIYALDADNGDIIFSASTTEAIESSLAISKGLVYLTDASGRLYAFGNKLDPPENLSAIAGETHEVALSWMPVTIPPMAQPVSGYRVYRSLQPTSGLVEIAFVAGTASIYIDTGVTATGTYYYAVTAMHDVGGTPDLEESTFSNIADAYVFVPPVPPVVSELSALSGDGVIRLNWVVTPGDYRVSRLWLFRRGGTGSPFAFSRTIEASESALEDFYVENGVEYGYALVAVDVVGNTGPQSTEATATPYTIDWPMFRRNVLHEGSDPSVPMPPPLGEHWRASVTPIVMTGFSRAQEPIAVGGTVFAVSYGGGVVALKASTGGTVWQLSGFTGALSSPAYHNGIVYVTYGGGLKALNAANGNTEWELPAGDVGVGLQSSPIVYKNVLYMGMKVGADFKLVAVDIESRQVKWISVVGLASDIWTSPAAASDKVFIVDRGGNVLAFGANTGATLWMQPLGKNVYATEGLSLSVEPPVLQVIAFDGLLYSIRTTDGEILWSRNVGGRFGAPALFGGTVFTSSSVDNVLYARSINTGDIEWVAHTWTVTGTYINSGPTVTDGRVHVYATNGQLFTFDVSSGAKLGADKIRLTRAILMNYNQLTASRDQMYVTEGSAQIIAITPVNPAPTGLTAIEQSGVISLNWLAPTPNIYGITGYRIYRSRTLGVEGTPIADVNGANNTSFVDHDADPGWVYYYIVRAVDNRDVAGQPSSPVMVPTYLPFTLADIKAEGHDGYIQLSWSTDTSPYEVNRVDIYRKEKNGSLTYLMQEYLSMAGYVDMQVENRVGYTYVLRPLETQGRLCQLSSEISATPLTVDWPMFQRDMLHEGSDPDVSVSPPLGERWRVSLATLPDGQGFSKNQEAIVVGGMMYVVSSGGDVRALHAKTGSALWQKSGYSQSISSPAYYRDTIYFTHGNGITALDANYGWAYWTLPASIVGSGVESSPIVYKGVLYAGMNYNGSLKLVAVDLETHQVKWRSAGSMSVFLKASPAAAQGKVYIVDGGGDIRAYDAASGTLAWSYGIGESVTTTEGLSLSVSPPVLMVVHENGWLYALDATSGEFLRSWDVQGKYTSSAISGATVYVASDGVNTVYAHNIATGSRLWTGYTWTVTGSWSHGGPVVADGRVHVYTTNGQLFTLDKETGAALDAIRIENATLFTAHMSAGTGQLYVPTYGGQIIAVTPVNPTPTGLTAVEKDGVVTLNWSAPAPNVYGISGYRVFRSAVRGQEGTAIADVIGAMTTTYLDNMQTGSEYFYTVKAVDSRGVPGRSSNVAYTAVYIPIAITGVTADGYDGYTRLSWTVPDLEYTITKVDVYRQESDGTFAWLTRVDFGSGGVDDLSVENNILYSYEMRPLDGRGRLGLLSDVVSATPLTVDWPMFQRDMLHEGSDPDVSVSPPLGERWRVSLTTLPEGQGFSKNQGAIVVGATVFVVSMGGDVRALQADAGTALWQVDGYVGAVSCPAYYRGLLYFTHSNGLTALDAATGKAEWNLSSPVVGSGEESSPIVYKGVLYAGMNYGGSLKLVAVDVVTRQVKWMSAGSMSVFLKSSPAAAQGKVYIVDGGGNIRAYDAASGMLVWSKGIGENVSTTEGLSLSMSPPVLMVVHENGWLYAYGVANGEFLWSGDVQGKYTSPAISGATVYVGSDGVNTVYAHNIATGSRVWTGYTWTDTGSWAHGGPVVADGRIHVYTTNGQLFTLDKETGAALDALRIENAALFTAHMSAGAGQLYVPTYGGQIIAVTPVNPAPTGLTAVVKDGVVTLNWSAPIPNVYGISGYRVFRSVIQGQEGTAIADVIGAMTTTYLDSMQPRAEYYIKALDSRGVPGRPSNVASVAMYIPVTLAGVTVDGHDGYTRLSWTVPESEYTITQVDVYRKEKNGTLAWLNRVPSGPATFDDLSVENRLLYSYELCPVDSIGQLGLPSALVSATPLTVDWPMFQRDMLHEGSDPDVSVSPPLGERWRASFTTLPDGQGFSGYQGAIVVGGTVYVVSAGGDVRALRADTGVALWQVGGYVWSVGSPAYHRGMLYFTHSNGLTALNAATGKAEWNLSSAVVGSGEESSPIVYKGVLYAGMKYGGSMKLVAVDVITRQVKWLSAGSMAIFLKSSPAAAQGKVYIVDGGGDIRAYDAVSGTLMWSKGIGKYMSTTEGLSLSVSPPVLMIVHENGWLYAVRVTDGENLWNGYVQGKHTSPAISGATVYVASHEVNTVYAHNIATGSRLWTGYTWTDTGSWVQGGPVVADGRIHVYTMNGQLFTLDKETGAALDAMRIENAALFAAHMSAGAGQLYVPTYDGQLVAVTPVLRAPAELSAVGVVGGIRISWTPPVPNTSPVAGYNIYRAETPEGSDTLLVHVPGGESDGYTDPVLPGSVYYYRMTAVDDRGVEGRKTDQISAATLFPPVITAQMQVRDLAGGQFACPGHVYEVTGTALSSNFGRYTLELYQGAGFELLKESLVPVENGLLGTVTITGSGSPILRLTVYDLTGETGSASIYLESPVKNITAVVSWPDAGQIVPTDCSSFIAEVRGSAYADNFTRYRLKVVQTAPQTRVILDKEYLDEKRDTNSLLETVTFPECGSYVVDLVVEDKCSNTKTVESAIDLTSAEFLVSSVITFSARGRDPGEHRRPWDVAVDNEDYVWVVDTQNKRVQKYTADGQLLLEAGQQNTGKVDGLSFLAPVAAAVDSTNHLLVVDKLMGKIIRLDENGNPLDVLGGNGKGPGEFLGSEGVAVDGSGRIYVAETLNNRIQVVDAEGRSLLVFGAQGSEQGQFDHPNGVGVDPHTGNIIVTDTGNNRVQIFSPSGEFLTGFGIQGAGAGNFDQPHDIVVGLGHNLFVSEVNNDRASWFTLFGTDNRWLTAIPPLNYMAQFLKQPHGLALDRQETMLYIADTGNNRVVGVPIKRGGVDAVMPRAVILSPVNGGTVTGFVDIQGIAADAHFAAYRLEYGNGTNPAIWSSIALSTTPVWDSTLGEWDTRSLVPGPYSLRLTVTDKSNNTASAVVAVQVNNQPSALIVSASAQPSVFIPDQSGVVFTYCLSAPAAVRALIVGNDSNHPLWTSETIVPGGYGGMAGSNIMAWDGRDEHGQWVLPGRYTMLIIASAGAITDKKSVPIIADLTLAERSRGLGGTVSGGASGSVASAANSGGSDVSGSGGSRSNPDGSGSGASGSSSTGSGTHDNGMGNGKNPKDFDRGSNPGQHGGNGKK